MKSVLSGPVTLTVLLATILVVPLSPAYGQSPTVSVNPNTVSTGMGSSFTVTVDVFDVPSVVGYDVTLLYNSAALSATSVDFDSPATLFGGLPCAPGCNLALISTVSNSLGEIRSARVILGGTSAQSPGTLLSVTFRVTGASDSPLTLSRAEIAEEVNGKAIPVPVTIVSGNFFLPPNILFTAPNLSLCTNPNSPLCSAVAHTKRNPAHPGYIPLECYVQLDPAALRSGFGGCELDVRDPKGADYVSDTSVVFLLPGQTAQVEGTFSYPSSAALGTYMVFATTLECATNDPSSCSLGSSTVSAVLFRMNP